MTSLGQRAPAVLLMGGSFALAALFANWVTARMLALPLDPRALGERPVALAAVAFTVGVLAALVTPPDSNSKRFWRAAQPYFFFLLLIGLREFRPERWQYDLLKLLLTCAVTAALIAGLFHVVPRWLGIGHPPGSDA